MKMNTSDSINSSDNSISDVAEKSVSNDRFAALERELLKYHRKPGKLFYLKTAGSEAVPKLSEVGGKKSLTSPLYVEDISNLLLRSLLGYSPFKIHWLKLEPNRKKFRTVLVEIKGLSQQDISTLFEPFQSDTRGSRIIEILSSNLGFASELCTVRLSDFYAHSEKNYSSLFPVDRKRKRFEDEKNITETDYSIQYKLTKLNLLLKPIELAMESYPLPVKQFNHAVENYCFTKDKYNPVSIDSTIFALDCEMGVSVNGRQEVLWIAIVDEKLKIVYQSFVKPKEKIVDYKTEYSGVTEEMLRDVKTTLNDVQKKIKEILPNDAILCGQSLNFDLHALKLIHPYIIDTSVIFNLYGSRGFKLSLKILAWKYLKETIQKGVHNPVEDARAAMKLVLFRLKNTLNNINLSQRIKQQSFFARISGSSLKVCLVGSEDSLKNYAGEIPNTVTFARKSNMKEIMEEVSNKSKTHNLVLSHLVMKPSTNSIPELKDEIKKVYRNVSNNTLFYVIISDVHKNLDENFKFNYCIIALKKPLCP